MTPRRLATALFFSVFLHFPIATAQNLEITEVQSPGAVPAPVISSEDLLQPATPAMTHNDLDAFLSGIIGQEITSNRAAGAIVSVVKDGDILITKGFGNASLSPEIPVDPNEHMFRLASISKTITWIALYQLVDQGLLSLDDPINQHLPVDLQIPDDGFGNPILIRHLVQHQPGFEDLALGHLFIKSGEDVPTLQEYLIKYQPKRVRSAGQISSYSNYGAALAGAIIAEKSGLPFEAYVEEAIFKPLGLENFTFREPFSDNRSTSLPPMDMRRFAKGMEFKDGAWKERPFIHINQIAPAASLSASATDFALFMRALLSFEDGGAKILSRARWEALSSGISQGFFTYDFGTLKAFGHDGSALAFQSRFIIDRDHQLGVFISVNSETGSKLVKTLPYQIAMRYFPDSDSNQLNTPLSLDQETGGYYRTTRRPYRGFQMALLALNGTYKLSFGDKDVHLKDLLGKSQNFTAVNGLFKDYKSGDRLEFLRGTDGKIHGFVKNFNTTTFERLSTLHSPPLLITSWVVGLLLANVVLARFIWRRLTGRASLSQPHWARRQTLISAGLWPAYTIVTVVNLIIIGTQGSDSVLSYPTTFVYLNIILGLALTASILTNIIANFNLWYRSQHGWIQQTAYSGLALIWALAILPLWEVGL
ncbi:MAG: serine hydrolase domain-containing protein, partial [Sphingomonadales bacterium]